ncbi:MAG: response regulator [Deltaproteobacteria bacterium]|nr:response regulator [Deltaproteobacteria bacterium]
MENINRIKVLLVDDEEEFLQLISKRFELKDFDVIGASSGKEAIEAAENGLFDVAIVDLQMPGMNGAELLKILKEKHRYLEIIILTGHATIDSAVECARLGAFKYLEKPYNFEKLVDIIRDAYETRLKKKFESNKSRMEEIQRMSLTGTPLEILKALARLDNQDK